MDDNGAGVVVGNCVIPSPWEKEDFHGDYGTQARWYGNGGDFPAWLHANRWNIY